MFTNIHSDIFAALADPTRKQIIEILSTRGKLPATEIYGEFNFSYPAISQHLKVLRNADLVTVEKKAQQRFYQINQQRMTELEVYIHQLTQHWNKHLDRLDMVLRKEVEKHGRTR